MMKDDLQRLYRDEMEYLRLQGREFSQRYPQLAPFLAEKSSDPDVERLLESFSFLSARLRQKIEDDFPELTHSLLNLLWPNYLRPLPSMTMIKFTPKHGTVDEKKCIEKQTKLLSKPLAIENGESTPCFFRTTRDCYLYPIQISGVHESHSREKSTVSLELETIHNQSLYTSGCDELDVFLSGNSHTALTIYLWLFSYLDYVEVCTGDEVRRLQPQDIQAIGFSPEDALLPYPKNVFDGYRIIQEFFGFQQGFYAFKIKNLLSMWSGIEAEKTIINFCFHRAMPTGTIVREQDFSLYCVPAINLFTHSSEPIVVDGKRSSYPLIPAGNAEKIYDIFSVDSVEGVTPSGSRQSQRTYFPFESFQHEVERQNNRDLLYYKVSVKESRFTGQSSHEMTFMRSDESAWLGQQEIMSVSMLCTNADLPSMLGVGDICVPTEVAPPFADFTNITKPTKNYLPVLDSTLHWSLISNLALNYLSLLEIEPLKNILRCYDFVARQDIQVERQSKQRLDALRSIDTKPIDRLIRGLPVRGLESTINIHPDGFLCDGEVYLFGTVLAQFFSLYSSINSFHQLKVCNLGNNEVYEWTLEQGKQPVI